MGRLFAPSQTGLRKPTDPQKENGMVVNTPRYLEFGGLDKASKTSPSVNKAPTGKKNVYGIVKPGKGSSR